MTLSSALPVSVPASLPTSRAGGSAVQWCTGALILGWGLSILAGIVPHEDVLVGAGLAVLGAALALASRPVPSLPRVPAPLLVGVGLVLAAGGGLFLLFGWHLPKAAVLLLGLALLFAAPFQGRSLRAFGQRFPVATLTFSLLPLALGPAAVYAAQGLFRHGTGTTPLESFLEVGLIAPVASVLSLLGWAPVQEGQMLTYMTLEGPMRVEVGVACSGLQAMALFAGMLGVLLAVERPPPGRTALLLAVGLGGVYVCNLLRLVLLTVVGHAWGADALERAHAQAGWVLFVAWALLFAWWARRMLGRAGAPAAGRLAQ